MQGFHTGIYSVRVVSCKAWQQQRSEPMRRSTHEDKQAVGLNLVCREEALEHRWAATAAAGTTTPAAAPIATSSTAHVANSSTTPIATNNTAAAIAEHGTRHVASAPRAVADNLAVDGHAAQLVGVDRATLAQPAQLGMPA